MAMPPEPRIHWLRFVVFFLLSLVLPFSFLVFSRFRGHAAEEKSHFTVRCIPFGFCGVSGGKNGARAVFFN